MPPLLRRRLQCFYCGRRSAQSYRPGLVQWNCENCEAENYLDQNGEITDPPHTRTVQPHLTSSQYTTRSTSPPSSSIDSLFCQTCLNNQALVRQHLAEYLPAPDHPKYQQYLANEHVFKQRVEEQYPQICQNCEPRVQARIRETGYAAKTDHLRRLMQNTRQRGVARQEASWWFLLVRIAALFWWLGCFGQILWHAMGSLAITDIGLKNEDAPLSLTDCIVQAAKEQVVDQDCVDHGFHLGSISLRLALVSIWFNPAMLKGTLRRSTGLGEYYKLQLFLSFLRTAASYFLGGGSTKDLDPLTAKRMHAIMLVLNIIIPFIAYRSVGVLANVKVSFQDQRSPLATVKEKPTQVTPPEQQGLSSLPREPFPINTLSLPAYRPETPPCPPTPSLDEYDSDIDESVATESVADSDMMDIDTPVRDRFDLPRPRAQKRKSAKPSPFHSALPHAPPSESQKLHNPIPVFPPAADSSQNRYFGDLRGGQTSTAQGANIQQEPPCNYNIAPGRFFAPRAQEDTGLEDLIRRIFSFSDEPAEVREVTESSADVAQPGYDFRPVHAATIQPARRQLPQGSLAAITSLLSLAFWFAASVERSQSWKYVFRLLSSFSAVAVACIHLTQALNPQQSHRNLSDILNLLVNLGIALVLGWNVSLDRQGEAYLDIEGKMPWFYLGLAASVQIFSLFRSLSMGQVSQFQVGQPVQPQPEEPLAHSQFREGSTTLQPSTSLAPQTAAQTSFEPQRSQFQNSLTQTPARNTRSQARPVAQPEPSRRDSIGSASGFSGLSLGLGDSPGPRNSRSNWNGSTRRQAGQPWEWGNL